MFRPSNITAGAPCPRGILTGARKTPGQNLSPAPTGDRASPGRAARYGSRFCPPYRTRSLRDRLRACDHLGRRGVDALDQRLDLLAADVLHLDAHPLGVGEKASVLERLREGRAQR